MAFEYATSPATSVSTGSWIQRRFARQFERRVAIVAAMGFALATYLLIASYLTISHRETMPQRHDVIAMVHIGRTATPETYAGHVWMPVDVTAVDIFAGGRNLGKANAVYDDPTRNLRLNGRAWKFVEFNFPGPFDKATERVWIKFHPPS